MMYIHYCQACHRIHMLNGHKTSCPTCEQKLKELKISYMEYIELGPEERNQLKDRLKNLRPQTVLKK